MFTIENFKKLAWIIFIEFIICKNYFQLRGAKIRSTRGVANSSYKGKSIELRRLKIIFKKTEMQF